VKDETIPRSASHDPTIDHSGLAEGFSERDHRRARNDGFIEIEKRCFHILSIRVGLAKLEPPEIKLAPMTLDGVAATSYGDTNFPSLCCCSQEGE
jgi:hypothetical protein